MIKLFVVCLLASVATAEYGWKTGTEYRYQVRGRTLTALHQVSNQYAGIVLKAILTVQPKTAELLNVKVSQAEYSQVQVQLPWGWSSEIPERQLSYKSLPLSGKPFEIKLKKGVVDELQISQNVPIWEVNILKSIVSQFQVDTQGVNQMKSERRYNKQPQLDAEQTVYKTMEDSVTGECETMYDLSPLPAWVMHSKPELVPLPRLLANGQIIDIVKTRNFSHCEQRVGYHFGMTGITDWQESGDNKLGNFMARSSVSRVIITGNLQRYTIQSSVTIDKTILSPVLYNAQKGIIVSCLNMTLLTVRDSPGSPQPVPSPRRFNDLVYDYNPVFGKNQQLQDPIRYSGRKNQEDNSRQSEDSSQKKGRKYNQSQQENSNSNESGNYKQRNERKEKYLNKSQQNQDSSSQQQSRESRNHHQRERPRRSTSGSSSSSGSSSMEDHQPRPTLNEAPKSPMLPFFIGYMGNSIEYSKEVNAVAAIKRLCSQIGSDLQNPSQIPEKDTLSKYTIIARLVRIMSLKQLEELTRDLYVQPSHSGSYSISVRQYAWKAFRDAVATAGTGPALQIIKEWILSRKVYGEEAAELIAVLPRTCRTPTQQYLESFFSLATKPEVLQQPFLNSTAILAFTDLVRKVQVNNKTAHNWYPVHSFGPFSPKDSSALHSQYIPYLARRLSSAVRSADSHQIQVYIRALGNLGHPKILSVFEPYLEGKETMSDYQRLLIVVSMDKLVRVYPELARRMLYNVYQNVGEAHEVRCASVFQLMKTNPPVYMLQRMAEFTNQDTSAQVNAAVKSSIETAAKSYAASNWELSQKARAAIHMLTPKQYGLHYSRNFIRSYMVKEMGLAYKQQLSYIGSSDSIWPNAFFYTNRRNLGGYKRQYITLGAMVSSVDDFLDELFNQFDDDSESNSSRKNKSKSRRNKSKNNRSKAKGGRNSSGPTKSPFSPEKIAELLGIEADDDDQVEGNLLFNMAGGRRYFTFDNTTIDRIPGALRMAASALRNGRSFNYTKLYNQFAVTISFPTPMGLPFVYTLKTPTLLSVIGEVTLKTRPDFASGSSSSKRVDLPNKLNATAEVHFVYSTKTSSKISFVTPFDHHRYIAGLDKNIQVNLPLWMSLSYDSDRSKVQMTVKPLHPERDCMVFHFSTWPYTTKHDILNLQPVSEDKNTELIHIREPKKYVWNFGRESVGLSFRAQYSSEQKFLDSKWLFNKAYRHDFFSMAYYPWAEKTIKKNDIRLIFEGQRSPTRSVTFTLDYDDDSEDSSSSEENSSSGSDSNESGQKLKNRPRRSNKNRDQSNQSQSNDSSDSKSRENVSNRANPSTSNPISSKRQEEFLRKVGAGISNSSSSVWDMAIEFNGPRKVYLAATVAYADSEVDEKARVLWYFHRSPLPNEPRPFEMCMTTVTKMPNVPMLNFPKALKADPTSYLTSELTFGEKCSSGGKISLKAKMEQSQERKEYIRQHPMTKLCQHQMEQHNYLLPACLNATLSANYLDSYSYSLHFERIPTAFKNATYKAYSMFRYALFPYLDENMVDVNNPKDRITVDVDWNVDLTYKNISISAPLMDADFKQIRIPRWVRSFTVQHPSLTPDETFGNEMLRMQYNPSCSIDSRAMNTFDNKTYPVQLGKCWHVMMQTTPDEDSDSSSSSSSSSNYDDDVSVLARDLDGNHKEIKVLLGEEDVIDMRPSGSSSGGGKSWSGSNEEKSSSNIRVFINGRPIRVTRKNVTQYNDQDNEPLVQVWALPSGAVYMMAPQHDLVILYDGERALLWASNDYRDDVRGLCGTFDGEKSSDFTTPKNCVLRDPRNFVSTWAVPDSSCQGPAKEMQRSAKSLPCAEKDTVYINVIDERLVKYYGGRSQDSSSSSSEESSDLSSSSCTRHLIRAKEEGSETCFTARPVPTCSKRCRARGMVEKMIPVHCVKSGEISKNWQKMIQKGGNPDFRNKMVSKTINIDIPEGCIPK